MTMQMEECCQIGHVSNVQYRSYFDTSVNRLLFVREALDIHDGDVAGFVADVGCSYFRPLAFPDTMHVGMRVAKLGSSSVCYELEVYRDDDPAPSAAGHFVHVYVDPRMNRSVPIPDVVKIALEIIAGVPSE